MKLKASELNYELKNIYTLDVLSSRITDVDRIEDVKDYLVRFMNYNLKDIKNFIIDYSGIIIKDSEELKYLLYTIRKDLKFKLLKIGFSRSI